MRIGQLGGIGIRLNNYFLVLLFFLALVGRLPETLVLFVIVIVHEIAHVLTAISFGQRVDEIELLPFGGVAKMEDSIEIDPDVEWWVALAGPLTNLFLLLVGYGMKAYGAFPEQWWVFFFRANITLAAFNLIPALPLDGGRIYRARLSRRIGFRKATIRAAKLGRALGVILLGLGGAAMYYGYANYSLPVVAFFVYFAASKELETAAYVFVRYLTRKKQELNEAGVIPAEQLVARSDSPVKDIVKHFVPKRFHVILVLGEEGDVKGLTTEWDVIQALFDEGIETPVGSLIRHDF